MHETVNLAPSGYGGSNPPLRTKEKSPKEDFFIVQGASKCLCSREDSNGGASATQKRCTRAGAQPEGV